LDLHSNYPGILETPAFKVTSQENANDTVENQLVIIDTHEGSPYYSESADNVDIRKVEGEYKAEIVA
jgi:hypothetical protein